MDRKRVSEEVIEVLCNKLHALPLPSDDEPFDYDNTVLMPEITKDKLDIAEVSMDLEDAFGIHFDELVVGEGELDTIGKIIDFITAQIASQHVKKVGAES